MHRSELENNILLDFSMPKNVLDGGILIPKLNNDGKPFVNTEGNTIHLTPYVEAFYMGLKFTIYETERITIEGSMHIYYNAGAHNFNDFDYHSFINVVHDLVSKFNINPAHCRLKNLEIGINIEPIIPTNDMLEYSFLHGTKPFEWKYNSRCGKYKQVEHSQFIIKFYNKALHYQSKGFNIDTEILRFEIKYTKMEKLNKKGIYTLDDLMNYDFSLFENDLLCEWGKVLFYDNTIKSNSKRTLYYNNPTFWNKMLNPTKSCFYNHKENLREMVRKNSEHIQEETGIIMRDKIRELTRGASFDSLYIESIPTPQERICSITNLNISMQKEGSFNLSEKGIKYYYDNDNKVFEELKRKYLSDRWNNTTLDKQIFEIYHNIRNTKSNQQMKQKRIYPIGQTNMLAQFNYQ